MPETILAEAIVTLTRAREGLSIPSSFTTDDDMITQLINYRTGGFERLCKRRLMSRPYIAAGAGTDRPALVVDGPGGDELVMPEWPVTAVTAARERLSPTGTTPITITGLRVVAQRILYLPGGWWPKGRANIEVDCVAGLTEAEDGAAVVRALQGAFLRQLQIDYADWKQKRGRSASISNAGTTVSLDDKPIAPDVEMMLRRGGFMRVI